MLEAGADFSLESDHGAGLWFNSFVEAVEAHSIVNAPIHSQI
jgi:hypothetical protein